MRRSVRRGEKEDQFLRMVDVMTSISLSVGLNQWVSDLALGFLFC